MIEIGMGGGGGRNYLLLCINTDHRVGVTVQWCKSLRLGSLVRGDDINNKVGN